MTDETTTPTAPQSAPAPGGATAEDTPGATAFLKHHLVFIGIAVGVALLVLFAVIAYLMQQQRSAERASHMLMLAKTPQQKEEILVQYPASAAAPLTLLALAADHYDAGAYDQAQARYTEFLERYARHPMAATATLGKVMCQEARGEYDQALVGFETFLGAQDRHYLAPQAILGKARCLRALQRLNEAKAVYEDFIAAHPEGGWTPQAEAALSALVREIQRQPAAPAPPAVAPTDVRLVPMAPQQE